MKRTRIEFEEDGKKMSAEKVSLTPALAEHFMECNARNRLVNKANLKRLIREIENGDYIFNPAAPIVFDGKGNMINGQHHCISVIKTETPIPMMIYRGCDPSLMDVLDSGKQRSIFDSLYIRKVANARDIGAALNIVYQYYTNKHRINCQRESKKTLVKFYYQHEKEFKKAAAFVEERRKEFDFLMKYAYGIWIAMYFIMSRISQKQADEFFHILLDDKPPKFERNVIFLRGELKRGGHIGRKQEYKTAFIIRTWNAYRSKGDVVGMQWLNTENNYHIEAI